MLRIKCNGTRPKAIRTSALRRANTGVLTQPRRRNYVHSPENYGRNSDPSRAHCVRRQVPYPCSKPKVRAHMRKAQQLVGWVERSDTRQLRRTTMMGFASRHHILRDRLRNSASNAEPCQPAGEIAGREIDLQNSSVSRIARGLGAVKDRRRVEPNVSGVGKASDAPAALNNRFQFAFRNLPEPMRSGRDEKRRVCLRHRIQMNAERHHAGQQIKRWRYVKQPALDGPRAKALRLPPA